MSSRPRVVPDAVPDTNAATAEFEVDAHGAESVHDEPTQGTPEQAESPEVAPVIVIGWTPQEAGQLIASLWNFGMIIYGPDWATQPWETAGWDIAAAQLLDQYVPKGSGGMVQLGAGLIMVGNGLAMMGVRRIPIIKRGPRPMFARRPAPDVDEVPQQQAAPPAPSPNGGGKYHMAPDIAPASESPLNGLGL
jgi:hypothetical protein